MSSTLLTGEIRRRKGKGDVRETCQGGGKTIKTGLQGQGHAERIICTSNSVFHMQAVRQMCAEGQKEEGK